jgi:hypothetical protein
VLDLLFLTFVLVQARTSSAAVRSSTHARI